MNIDTEEFSYFQYSFIYRDRDDKGNERSNIVFFGSGVVRQKYNQNFQRTKIIEHYAKSLHYHDINIFSWSKITKEEFYGFNFVSQEKRNQEEISEEEIITHSTTTRIL